MSVPSTALAAATIIAVGAFASTGMAQVRFHGEAGGATMKVMSWRDIPFRTVVRQQFDYSCGSAALATLLTYHYRLPTTEAQTFKAMYATGDQTKIRKVGFSMLDMKRYLESRGLRADGYRITLKEIGRRGVPAIALIDLGKYRHFVVIKGVQGDKVLLGDPARGLRTVTAAEFQKMWNGIAFSLNAKDASFNAASEWTPWSASPIRAGAAAGTVAALTLDQQPLYQVSIIRSLDSIVAGGPQ